MSSAVTSDGGVGSLAPPEIWRLCLTWLERSAAVISSSAAGLNAINVFPVPDSDTGTNLQQTLTGIIGYLDGSAEAEAADVEAGPADLVVRAAVLSAHGNSGAIVAEMIISLSRALERSGLLLPTEPERGLARVLRTVATAGRRAVARPVAGTILTVAAAAADAAEGAVAARVADTADDPLSGTSRVLAVARVAREAAAEALARTPQELDRLAEAGVVDAGGQAYVLLLDVLVEVLGGPVARPLAAEPGAAVLTARPVVAAEPGDLEVMYALRGTGPDDLDTLRERLSVLGDSVVVVGDRTVAQVHVHTGDAGAAVEAGLPFGRMSQIRITPLPPTREPTAERAVVAVVAGPGLARAVTDLGGIAVLPAAGHVTAEELSAVLGESCGEVVVLPNDMECLEIATHLVGDLRAQGRRVAVIPTVAQVQGLAALAVHEPGTDFDSAVVAMSSTAGHTRHGAVTVAESPAMTMAGRCETGDVLGLVEGDFVEIGGELDEVAWRVVERLLGSGGGELLTLVRGRDADDRVVGRLRARVRAWSPSVDVEVVDGGQPRYPLLVGLE